MAGTPGDSGPGVNVAIWILLALAVMAVGIRIHARLHRFGLDDYVMFLSLLLDFAACICASIAISHGVGKHFNTLSPNESPLAILWGNIAIAVGVIADTIPKLAIALLINKVLSPNRLTRCFMITISIVLICIGISLAILSFQQCHPIAHQWQREKVPGSCWSPLIVTYCGIAAGVYSSILDLLFSIYPPLILSRLKMRLRKKMIIMVIFSLGLFSLFTTVYKTAVELPKLKYEQVDASRVVAQVILWTNVEASVVIIAGSIPTWGWIFPAERLSRVVSWIKLHSLGTVRTSERLSSEAGEVDKESDRAELGIPKQGGKEGPNPSVALQSIDRIERMAYS